MSFRSNRNRGFTLIEAIFSIIMLVLVWIAAANLVFISNSSGSMAKHKTQAIYVIQQTIEDLRKKPFTNITSSTTAVSLDSKGTPDDSSDDITGTRIITVSSPSQYYKNVIVELRWNELFPGRSKTVREYCGTYIANDPQAN